MCLRVILDHVDRPNVTRSGIFIESRVEFHSGLRLHCTKMPLHKVVIRHDCILYNYARKSTFQFLFIKSSGCCYRFRRCSRFYMYGLCASRAVLPGCKFTHSATIQTTIICNIHMLWKLTCITCAFTSGGRDNVGHLSLLKYSKIKPNIARSGIRLFSSWITG